MPRKQSLTPRMETDSKEDVTVESTQSHLPLYKLNDKEHTGWKRRAIQKAKNSNNYREKKNIELATFKALCAAKDEEIAILKRQNTQLEDENIIIKSRSNELKRVNEDMQRELVVQMEEVKKLRVAGQEEMLDEKSFDLLFPFDIDDIFNDRVADQQSIGHPEQFFPNPSVIKQENYDKAVINQQSCIFEDEDFVSFINSLTTPEEYVHEIATIREAQPIYDIGDHVYEDQDAEMWHGEALPGIEDRSRAPPNVVVPAHPYEKEMLCNVSRETQ